MVKSTTSIKFTLGLVLGFLLAFHTAASAAIFRIEATSKVVAFSDFTIEFDDLDGDSLYSKNELTHFSGVFFSPATSNEFLETLVRFQRLTGISDDSNISGIRFDTLNRVVTAPVSAFDFSIAPVVTAVPLPAAVWLLLAGVLGLGFVGRRRMSTAT